MRLLLTFLFCNLFTGLYSQEILELRSPLAEIHLSNLEIVSLDTRDQIFASTASGDIYLFSKSGKEINLFSPPRQARIQQLEASWTVNIFTFSSDLQEYRVMDRFLNPIAENSLLLDNVILPKAATLGNNNVIWVWDESDLSLKSVDYLRKQIIQSQPLNLILASDNLRVTEIREFKNRLFMNVPESGIFIFDNQGNYLKKVAIQIEQRMCFYKENLFWVEGKNLKGYSLTSQAFLDLGELPSGNLGSVQIGQDIITFVEKDRILVYALPERLKRIK
ncbi:hypothetical protein [Algoriphagus sp.]|uniref:hypothetical protein n=1 Tax=Algoriphagus sp. TaxID=1872435 RepID=UPI003918D30F